MARKFNKTQRQALFILAGGKCQRCGRSLPDDWHADHKHPASKGGSTDVTNGQALCPDCNLKKGDKTEMTIPQWPADLKLRPWQSEAKRRYFSLQKDNFLLVAVPAAGKTIGSLAISHQCILERTIKRLVIVCPTDHLRNQWISDGTMANIHLDKLTIGQWGDIVLTADYIGIVTTYQQVLSQKETLRKFTSDDLTLVIFDEIHHCGEGENLSWGPAIRYAFEGAGKKLLLSGTPFRTDNSPIPFVTYEPDNGGLRCVPDYIYGYGDALKSKHVVRDIVFPAWDGVLTWSYKFEQKKATFRDELNEEDARHRLRTAIYPGGQWLEDVLRAANDKLDYIRDTEGHRDAGGLVTVEDKFHAEEVAKLLKKISGENPVVVTYDSENASDEITRYRNSTKKWIIAIKMVSEGVDIKRLRVGVYATNITSRLFFLQVIGRVLRWVKGIDFQTAYFYIPEDPRLVEYMKEIKQVILDWLKTDEEEPDQDSFDKSDRDPIQPGFYEFVDSIGKESNHYYNGLAWAKEHLEETETFFNDIPGFEYVPLAAKAQVLAKFKANGLEYTTTRENQGGPEPEIVTPMSVLKTRLKSRIKSKVHRLKNILEQKNLPIGAGNPYAIINAAWGRGKKYSSESTNDDLEAKLVWLDGLIKRALDGKWNGTELR